MLHATVRFKLSIEADCLISVATEEHEPTPVISKHTREVVEIWYSFSARDVCDLPTLEPQKGCATTRRDSVAGSLFKV